MMTNNIDWWWWWCDMGWSTSISVLEVGEPGVQWLEAWICHLPQAPTSSCCCIVGQRHWSWFGLGMTGVSSFRASKSSLQCSKILSFWSFYTYILKVFTFVTVIRGTICREIKGSKLWNGAVGISIPYLILYAETLLHKFIQISMWRFRYASSCTSSNMPWPSCNSAML